LSIMGLNICVFLFIGLFVHSIKAQCTEQESESVKTCLQQAMQGQNAGVLQMAGLSEQAGPCLQQAGCSSGGVAGVFGQFLGGNNQQQQPQNGNEDQCYTAVGKQVRQYMGECIKQKSPNFNKNEANIGAGHHGGGGGQSNVMQELNQKCNNDKVKVREVKACMLNTPTGQQQYQQIVREGCACKMKVSPNCQRELEQHRRAACECAKEVEPKYEQFEQQEQQLCQGTQVEPDGIVAVFQKMDCNNDPCQNQG